MFSFFRRRKAPPQGCSIYINGHLYTRVNDDIICIMPDRTRIACSSSHVTPNGVHISQIACALAAIENRIHISVNTSIGRFDRSRIGLN